MYKHGPYSTDIEDNLDEMKSYATEQQRCSQLSTGMAFYCVRQKMASFVKERVTLPEQTQTAIERVCQFIRFKNVGELERLVTAAWIRSREGLKDIDEVAQRLNQLKPHISLAEAREADREVHAFLQAD